MSRSASRSKSWIASVVGTLLATASFATAGACLLELTNKRAAACPFCGPTQATLSEEIIANDLTVICKLVDRPAEQAADAPPEASECTFEVVRTVKGAVHLAQANRVADAGKAPVVPQPQRIKILYFGEQPIGTKFLTFGIVDGAGLAWGTPTVVTDRAVEYIAKLPTLPESGAERLAFFQDYLDDSESLLSTDSYDEFAIAPYSDLQALKDRMPHDKLLQWIQNKETTTSRRRLYLCMLSVCGKPSDVPVLEAMIRNEDRQTRTALDAMIGSYLQLKGPEGMPLIEDLFLKKADAEYTDTYSAIMALRFMGQESNVVSRERLKEGMRHMLARPKLADLIIPDLMRWQDWTVMDQLVKLFKDADQESTWVRVPVVNYLRACPLPEAKVHLEELAKIDPDAVRRASMFFPATGAAAPAPEGAGTK